MRVYRIEHKVRREGPYTFKPDGLKKQYYDHMHRWKECPTPYADGIDDFYPGIHFCGFDSTEAMREWFGIEVIKALVRDHGFVVAEIKVPKKYVSKGKRQLVYERHRGSFVRELDVDEIEFGRTFQFSEISDPTSESIYVYLAK